MNSQEDNNQEEESEVCYELCELMSKLPTEVTFDILSRLSIRNLSRCRWISKAWYYTINNPNFRTMQHNKLIKNNSPCVVLRGRRKKSDKHGFYCMVDHESLDSNITSSAVTLITPRLPLKPIRKIYSCNGLMLLDVLDGKRNCFYICNPITGEHNQLPEPFWAYAETRFGFDPATGVFKVIRAFNNDVQVYSSRVGKWRLNKKASIGFCIWDDVLQDVFVNGALHWLGSSSDSPPRIISLSFDTEEFKLIPLPHGLDLSTLETQCRYLVVFGDCLSLVTAVGVEHVEIWVMKEYGLQSSWDKKYIIQDMTIYRPITLMPNGEILTVSHTGKFGFYNHETKAFRSIDIGVDSVYRVSVTVSSLISPNAGSIVNW